MGRKLGAVPLLGELGPHLTMWPEPKPTCMPSFILIHPTVWSQYTNVTDIQTDKPVGFQGPIVPPVPNANSSECPQFGMPADLRSLHAGAARRLLLHAGDAVRFQPAHTIRCAGGCRNGKFQNVSPPSVLFESSRFFLQYTGDTDAENDGPEF